MEQVICANSLEWLKDRSIPNVITGLPDLNEVKLPLDSYIQFFQECARLIFQAVSDDGYAIFIQTDRKINRQLLDKSYLLTKVANDEKVRLLWHKIVLNRDVGKTDLYRPTYSHMLCYSRLGRVGSALPDVYLVSKKAYPNATPEKAAEVAVSFVKKQSRIKEVVDPFCGRGTIGSECLKQEVKFTGVDIDPDQVRLAMAALRTHSSS